MNTIFVLSKGIATLTPLQSAELARKMLAHARRNYFMAKQLGETGLLTDGPEWATREAKRPVVAHMIQEMTSLLRTQSRDLDR